MDDKILYHSFRTLDDREGSRYWGYVRILRPSREDLSWKSRDDTSSIVDFGLPFQLSFYIRSWRLV